MARLRVTTASHPQRLPRWSANVSGCCHNFKKHFLHYVFCRRGIPKHTHGDGIHHGRVLVIHTRQSVRLPSPQLVHQLPVHLLLVRQGTVLRWRVGQWNSSIGKD